MKQCGSYRTDFHEIFDFSIFKKFIKKIQISLKADKKSRYFALRQIYSFDQISLSSSQTQRLFRQNLYIKSEHTFHVQQICFSSKIMPFMR